MYKKNEKLFAGVDEVGRGSLAGPVVAASCIFLDGARIDGIGDSKTITPSKRYSLYKKIIDDPNVLFAIGIVEHYEIDEINILQASLKAMSLSVNSLSKKPDFLLVDGPHYPPTKIEGRSIIKGDRLFTSIGAASIVAKCTRDQLMVDLHDKFPVYGFNKNKGYATKEHIRALECYGPSTIHRRSFEPVKSYLKGSVCNYV